MDCELCGLPVEGDGRYCCRGCLLVDETLEDVDVDVEGESEREAPAVEHLGVEGMTCTTCELYVESRAENVDGVEYAAASYPSNSVEVGFDPDVVSADELPGLLDGRGYSFGEPGGSTHEVERLGRLAVGGFFGMMTMLMYVLFVYPGDVGLTPVVEFEGFARLYLHLNLAVFAGVVVFYAGWPTLRGAYVAVLARQPNTDLLVGSAALSAYVYSLGAVALGRPDVYFDVSVAVVLAVSVGGYVEDRVKARALDVLESRLEASVDVARTVEGREIGVEDVDGGDRLLVRRGERFPVDGVVVEGDGHVDESVVTGVSRPIRRREGDDVLGGSVALDSAFEVEAGDGGSTLDRLTDVVRSTHASSPGVQRLTDRLSTAFVPVVLGLSAMSFAGWLYLTGEFETSLLTALVVLVVSCPCALGVAGPLARAAGVRSALEARVVVTDDSVFERVEDVEHVVFDKTGTLTRGEMDVAVVHGDDEAVEMAAAVESYDDRPHARAFDAVADGGGDVDGFEALDRGVLGYVEGHEVFAGHPDIAVEREVDFDGFRDAVDDVESDGLLPVVVSVDGRVRAVAGLGDSVADGWRDVVEFVAGDDVRLMTGDDRATPEFDGVFDEVYRGLPPEAKAEAVERLSADGGVCFVGDGVNDGPALASADVGVCLGRAALTVESADATSLDGLDGLREFLRVSRSTRRRIRENVGWALVYNAVAVPLAVAGVINPLFAAVAMASSSLLVVANSSRRL